MEIHRIQNKNGEWFLRIMGTNGRKVCVTESYSSKTKATKTARALLNGGFSCIKDEKGDVVEWAADMQPK